MAREIVGSFTKRFPNGPIVTVSDFRHRCDGARTTVLFGPSGAGKTTLLRCLAGLEQPDSGTIRFGDESWFDGERLTGLTPQRRNVGYLSQDYSLFPHLNVEQNIAYGLRGLAPEVRDGRVAEMIRMLGLHGLESRFPAGLSGGEQQRVALGRAVVRRPRLLLLDEPLSGLDLPTRTRVRGELRGLLSRFALPVILVTHDRTEALTLGDDLVVMDRGSIVQSGPVAEVFSRPASVAAAGIVAVETVQPARVVECADGLATIAIGEIRLIALAVDLPVGVSDVFVCIRAEDVMLLGGDAGRASARNHLPAVVKSLLREGPMMRIELDCGFPLTALLTKQACEELALRQGARVVALVKAPQIHLVPR